MLSRKETTAYLLFSCRGGGATCCSFTCTRTTSSCTSDSVDSFSSLREAILVTGNPEAALSWDETFSSCASRVIWMSEIKSVGTKTNRNEKYSRDGGTGLFRCCCWCCCCLGVMVKSLEWWLLLHLIGTGDVWSVGGRFFGYPFFRYVYYIKWVSRAL